MNERIEELLVSIDKKLSSNKKDLLDNLGILSTFNIMVNPSVRTDKGYN